MRYLKEFFVVEFQILFAYVVIWSMLHGLGLV